MSIVTGVSTIGVEAIAGELARAKPVVSITEPTGTISDDVATLAFTYTSPVGRTQHSYRFQIRSENGSTVLYDSFEIVSSASSGIDTVYLLSSGATYQIWVRTSDGFDTSDWDVSTFQASTSGVADFPDEPRVGSIFEIAINGVGYMLADDPDTPVQRQLVNLDPPRFATTSTPFSEAVERYTFLGTGTWPDGAGQTMLNRADSSPQRFWKSEGINPFEDGVTQLLPDTVQSDADTYATPLMVVASGLVFYVTDTGELSSQATPEGSVTTFSITGAGAVTDLATDGTYWYFADGSDIFRNSAAADPSTAWSTINADVLEWAIDRLAVVYDDGGGNLAVSTLADDGTEEVVGGRFLYPDTLSIPDMTAGDGYLWFIVNRSDRSEIHFWQVGSEDTYAAAGLTLPQGQQATEIGFYLGNVFVRAIEELDAGGTRAIIYRCIPNEGRLAPERILDFESDTDLTLGDFTGNDRFVLFTWSDMTEADGFSGLGCIDLSTGGWAKWLSSGVTGDVLSVAEWNGKTAFTVAGSGLYVESEDPIASGFLETSIADLGSSINKIFDSVVLATEPIAGGSVDVAYTLNHGVSYTALTPSMDTAGLTQTSWEIGQRDQSIGLRITITHDTGVPPKLRFIQVKLHPQGLADQILVLPINCSDSVKGVNGMELPQTLTGMARYRSLEQLLTSRVRLQDVDWPVTQVASIWEAVSLNADIHGVPNRKLNRRVDTGRALLTLRKEA